MTTNKYAAYQSQDEKAEPITAPTASSSAQNNIPDDDEFGYSNSSFGRQGNSDDSLDNQSKPSPPKTQFSYASILGNTSKPTELDVSF